MKKLHHHATVGPLCSASSRRRRRPGRSKARPLPEPPQVRGASSRSWCRTTNLPLRGAAGISRAGLGDRNSSRPASCRRSRSVCRRSRWSSRLDDDRRPRRLRRHAAPRHRRPAARLELDRRPATRATAAPTSTMMCLVRTGPMWMLTAGEGRAAAASSRRPGNGRRTARSSPCIWSKAPSGRTAMPFTSEDVIFSGKTISSIRTSAAGRQGRSLRRRHEARRRSTTTRSSGPSRTPSRCTTIYQMALRQLLPGPAHILKPLHPKYNQDATYDSYKNALKPE